MNNIDTIKTITRFVVSIGASKIVSSIIKNNAVPVSKIDKVTIYAGSFVLGEMVSDAAKTYTDARIDKYVDIWKRFGKKVQSETTPN